MEGAWRSRTLLFLSFRDSADKADQASSDNRNYTEEEETSLIVNRDSIILEPSGFQWLPTFHQANELLLQVELDISRLDKLQNKLALPSFKDRTRETHEIELIVEDITNVLKTCSNLVKALYNPSEFPSQRSRIASSAQAGLAAKVQSLTSAFRRKQSSHMRRLKGLEKQPIDITATSTSGRDSIRLNEDDLAMSSKEEHALNVLQASNVLVENRIQQIGDLASSIAELSGVFRDLSSLVIDQGTLLDRVDYNVEHLALHVTAAASELTTAARRQKSSGKSACILVLLLLIATALYTVYLRLTGKA